MPSPQPARPGDICDATRAAVTPPPGRSPWLITAGTGHRYKSLKNLGPDGITWSRQKIADGVRWLRDKRGTTIVISGMGVGFDLWFADEATKAGLDLWAYLPFADQTAKWNRADRAEHDRLCALAGQVVTVGAIPADLDPGRRGTTVNLLLHTRNTTMLGAAGAVFALFDPATARWDDRGRPVGGTHATIHAATRRRMTGVQLDPRAQTVRLGVHIPDPPRKAATA